MNASVILASGGDRLVNFFNFFLCLKVYFVWFCIELQTSFVDLIFSYFLITMKICRVCNISNFIASLYLKILSDLLIVQKYKKVSDSMLSVVSFSMKSINFFVSSKCCK